MPDVDLAEIKRHTSVLGVKPQLHFGERPTDNFATEGEVQVKLLSATSEQEWLEAAYQISVATWTSGPIDATYDEMLRAVIAEKDATVPLEAFTATFAITGVSRAVTHQIVRHRKMGFGQESLRVTDLRHHPVRVPDTVMKDDQLRRLYKNAMHEVKMTYALMVDKGVPLEEARALMPMGITTYIVVTGTLRAWIDYMRARQQDMAQREHRIIANKIRMHFQAMNTVWPLIKDRLGG